MNGNYNQLIVNITLIKNNVGIILYQPNCKLNNERLEEIHLEMKVGLNCWLLICSLVGNGESVLLVRCRRHRCTLILVMPTSRKACLTPPPSSVTTNKALPFYVNLTPLVYFTNINNTLQVHLTYRFNLIIRTVNGFTLPACIYKLTFSLPRSFVYLFYYNKWVYY